MCTLNIA
uniref:Uncharacterized protein n=1 Tax=Romanomermis culicivorax TaxID=13658 RepID=A0A915K9P4_ROMCU